MSRLPGTTRVGLGASRLGHAAASVLVAAGLLAGCANRAPTPAPATSPATTSASPSAATRPPATKPSASTTSAAPPAGMPVPASTGDSSVDATGIHSTADLPTAFQCPSTVTPITIPGTTPTGTSTARATPDIVVCASRLAKDEALYLWYYATPEEKLAALTTALDTTKYVRAGPNWVAGGTINADMGTVGGEVYR